jgi:hypothetical protein
LSCAAIAFHHDHGRVVRAEGGPDMPKIISDKQISDYLAAVDQSGVLEQSQHGLRLLEHLIDAKNAGQAGTRKAIAFGLDVSDRPETFGPSSDSNVRQETSQLRTAIAAFESSGFATTDLEVEIVGGSDRLVLRLRQDTIPEESLKDLRPVFFHKTPLLGRIVLGMCLGLVAVFVLVDRFVFG